MFLKILCTNFLLVFWVFFTKHTPSMSYRNNTPELKLNCLHMDSQSNYTPPPTTFLKLTNENERRTIRQNRLNNEGKNKIEPHNNNLLKVLRHEQPNQTPVWLMRQAGRYLPEFRSVREKFDFLTICKDPNLAAEISIQPYHRYPLLDAVIIFSDILVVPQAMGQPLQMKPGEGPTFDWRLETPDDINKLNLTPNIEENLGYVADAIYVLNQRLNNAIPIIGFCGGPFTVMAYMIEGRGSDNWKNARYWLYNHPKESHKLLDAISNISIEYLIKQYDAGASVLQIFETHAGILSYTKFEEFSGYYMNKIADAVKKARPSAHMIVFPKDKPSEIFKNSNFDGMSLSWAENVENLKNNFNNKIVFQGNLDPHILYSDDDIILKETHAMLDRFKGTHHIANLGHGMEPTMDPHKVQVFLESIKGYKHTHNK